MKYALILIILVLMSGCVQHTEQTKEKIVPVPEEIVVVGAAETSPAEPTVKEFSIRRTETGFSPDTIDVDVGDSVRLFITDMGDEDELERIGIEGMNIESFYTKGSSVVLEFKATEKGQFEFGDDARAERKGLIIVS